MTGSRPILRGPAVLGVQLDHRWGESTGGVKVPSSHWWEVRKYRGLSCQHLYSMLGKDGFQRSVYASHENREGVPTTKVKMSHFQMSRKDEKGLMDANFRCLPLLLLFLPHFIFLISVLGLSLLLRSRYSHYDHVE